MAENKKQEKAPDKSTMNEAAAESLEKREAELKAWEQRLMEEQKKLEAQTKKSAADKQIIIPRNEAGRNAKSAADAMRPVKLRLAMDKTKKDALFVGFNNRTYQIPRGRDVVVPYCVAKHIQETIEQDEQTAMLISMYEEQFEQRRGALV